jgi:hypothetical protein
MCLPFQNGVRVSEAVCATYQQFQAALSTHTTACLRLSTVPEGCLPAQSFAKRRSAMTRNIFYTVHVGNPEQTRLLGERGIGRWKMLLKRVLMKQDVTARTGHFWLPTGSSGWEHYGNISGSVRGVKYLDQLSKCQLLTQDTAMELK